MNKQTHANPKPVPATHASPQPTQLGPLPEEWRVVRLGEQIIQSTKKNKEKARISVYTVSNIQGFVLSDEFFDKRVYSRDLSNYKVVEKGDFAYNPYRINVGSLGLFKNENPGLVSPAYVVFRMRPNAQLDQQFLYLLLKSDKWLSEIRRFSMSRGSVRRSLAFEDLANLSIPLPPLAEQRAIAHVLRAVQRAREATERVIAATRELKKSLMRHLFTYGPVPVDATDDVDMQETDIGPIPAHWLVVKLGQTVILRSRAVSPSETPQARYVGLEHLDSGEIRIKRHGYALETKSAKFVFNPGNILYGKLRPYLDKSALAEWSGVCSTDILVLIPTKQVDPVFTAYLMHSSFVLQHAIVTTSGVNHPRTSWRALSQALIPLPPLSEQREIAHILQAVDRKLAAEEARRQALEALFKTLLHDLMTARRRLPADFIDPFAAGMQGLAPLPMDSYREISL